MLAACPLVETLSTAMPLVPPVTLVVFVAVAAWVASLIVRHELLKSRYTNGFASFGSGSAKPKDEKTLILEDEIAARKIDFFFDYTVPRRCCNPPRGTKVVPVSFLSHSGMSWVAAP